MPIAISDSYERIRKRRVEANEKELVKEYMAKFGNAQAPTRLSWLTGNPPSLYRKIVELLKVQKEI